MGRNVAIGIQNYNEIIEKNYFYVDKTPFIKEWWDSGDSVTLITRPRRFGKTLTMSMVEQFFSVDYAGRKDLFEGLSVWKEEKYHQIQGTYPVISLSFANVKETNYKMTVYRICQLLMKKYEQFGFLRNCSQLSDAEKEYFERMASDMGEADAPLALYQLSDYLYRYYGKKVIILLDEYDTPMQEAYVDGYWEELVAFTRSLFNATFKTNPCLERAIMTGITRVSKESIFSDLNNLKVVTTTSEEYADSFGFTEAEVFAAMDECGYIEKEEVKRWYDGFTFGKKGDIYNPWSILNYLDTGKFMTYWANTSSNSLVGKLIREGSKNLKASFEALLDGQHLWTTVDEQIVYNQLDMDEQAIWSFLLASGYLKVISYEEYRSENEMPEYELALTNLEVKIMFRNMIRRWFGTVRSDYNDFVKALLLGDVDAMNEYMNRVTFATFSSFDSGTHPSGRAEPERLASCCDRKGAANGSSLCQCTNLQGEADASPFYHGFVLGLIVELQGKYMVTSNRESGFGRYDVVLEPIGSQDDAIILEFKVQNARREKNLEETLENALKQIEEKEYAAALTERGIPEERIRMYGFAFEGKKVLIGTRQTEE